MEEKTIEYLNGWISQQNGVDDSDNPYKEQTKFASYVEWQNGWRTRYDSNNLEELDEEVRSALFTK